MNTENENKNQNKNKNQNNIKETLCFNNIETKTINADNMVIALEEKKKADNLQKVEMEKQNELKRLADAESDINDFISHKTNKHNNSIKDDKKVNIVNAFIEVALSGSPSDVVNKWNIPDKDGIFNLSLKVYDILSKNNALIQKHKFGIPPTKRNFKNVYHNIVNVIIPRLINAESVGRSLKISHYKVDETFKGFKIVKIEADIKTDIKTDVSPLETPKQ